MSSDYWKLRSVLVTGGSCFVAATLIRRLLALNARVHALVRPTSNLWRLEQCLDRIAVHQGDITDVAGMSRILAATMPDAIFHLATAKGSDTEPRQYVETSILGSSNLIELLRAERPCAHMIVTGSSTEYAPSDSALSESSPLGPVTLHGAVKAAAGLLYSHAARAHGLRIKQLRLFHVYGPWESPYRFLPTALNCLRTGKAIPLAAGESRRDWIHVDDVVDALLLAGTADSARDLFNIGSGVEYTNAEVLAILEELTGQKLRTQPGALPQRTTDSAHRIADISLAKTELGWSPKFSLSEGMANTLNWLEQMPGVFDRSIGTPPTVI